MAALTRGISFRRQGSSGMSWTDTWSFNEEGVLVRSMKEDVAMQQQLRFGGAALSRIHDLHFLDEKGALAGAVAGPPSSSSTALPLVATVCPPSPTRLSRSKSLGSVPAHPNPPALPPRKQGLRLLLWLKKIFIKRKPRS